LLYRQPAFLICTDPQLDLQILLQAYFYCVINNKTVL
jgi:hypothetical protein